MIKATEVKNSKIEDGIFCRRTISVEGHKPLYIARKGAFIITLPSDGENFPRDGREGEREGNERKRSHRKPNTMVIRGESAWVLRGYQFHPPSTEDPIQPPSPSLLLSYPPVARHWKFIELSHLHHPPFGFSHPPTLSWLDRRQAFRYLNNPPIRLSSGVGMISRIYSPSTYEE